MITFQYYSNNINSSKFAGYVTLPQFIEAIRNPNKHILELFSQIAYYESIGDMATKAKLKERLYSFTPCVVVNKYRRYDNILSFTGLMVQEFDHIPNASDLKHYLFNEYPEVIAAWVSPSKKGAKVLVKIPIVKSVDEFKSYFYGMASELWQFNGFDAAGKNAVLPLFQSYDSELLYRDNASTWDKKGVMENEFKQNVYVKPTPIESDEFLEGIIIKTINTGFDNITDNGHPQLRSLCIAIGGYIANNYIDRHKALGIIDRQIETHTYLKKGIDGYKVTARWALDAGMKQPIHLNIESNG